jgi:glycosyltransferase involved in cell wall biosynthesis
VGCGAGFDAGNTVQINNAIDIDRAERLQHPREQARRLLGLAQEPFIFGAIGRLVPVKGHISLIEAFAQVQSVYPQAQLAIIGEGRMRTELETAIVCFGMEGKVHLLGARDDALQYVRAFDAFVMPSLSEGLPLALLEGMSGHLPVIGSDIPSLRPILEDCGGRIFPVGDVAALATQLGAVLNLDAEQRRTEGGLAYSYLRDAHAIEDFRLQYLQLIEQLLAAELAAL